MATSYVSVCVYVCISMTCGYHAFMHLRMLTSVGSRVRQPWDEYVGFETVECGNLMI